jgi:glucosamine--fructose-6-phosphate aminotransferase (isomerizing)
MLNVDFGESIRRQPENLRRSGSVFADALGGVDLSTFEAQPLLLTGMGASLFAVQPAAAALRAAGRGAFALPPTDVLHPGWDRMTGACVGISQSGGSAETVAAFRRLSVPRLALTNNGGGSLAEVADVALPIGSEEDTGISVLTYTASVLAIGLLAARLGGPPFEPGAGTLSGLMAKAIERFEPMAHRFAKRLDHVRCIDVIGGGRSLPSAGYAALGIREAARVPTAWFETRQYLHGPIEAADSSLGAVVFGGDREVRLATDLASYGATVLVVTAQPVPERDSLQAFTLPEAGPLSGPILQAAPGQLLADALARRRGIEPGEFRHHQEDTKVQPY